MTSINDWATLFALIASVAAVILAEIHNRKTRAIASAAHEIARATSAHRYSVRVYKSVGSDDGLSRWVKINLEILNSGIVPINVREMHLFYSDKREGAMRDLFLSKEGLGLQLTHGDRAIAQTGSVAEILASQEPSQIRWNLHIEFAHRKPLVFTNEDAAWSIMDSEPLSKSYCDLVTME